MSISNEEMEKLIEQYKKYTEKIVNRFYYYASPSVKDELRHVGLIGLWKGILAYYKETPKIFDQKRFIDTICAYMRYEMADLFHKLKLIRISDNQWRNFVKVTKLLTANPDISEEQLKFVVKEASLRYDWYLRVNEMINPVSLDMPISKDSEADIYQFLVYNDNEASHFENQSYIDYIIDSAMYGIKLDRDKKLIRTWLNSMNNGKKLEFTELAEMYKLTSAMVGVIINRFIDVCRFVKDCEYEYLKNPNGTIYFPEITEKNRTLNGKKVPGVKWVLPNRKWKVEITIGKKKTIYIGNFEKYEDAVRARRDAEINHRGFSEIKI